MAKSIYGVKKRAGKDFGFLDLIIILILKGMIFEYFIFLYKTTLIH